ncbi:hypothetical protein BSZ39_08570 [Bowdeniella nasicola]|uniref:Glycoside hydrolase family 38 central domain-containing protein n=1 Tax=Bowdeniella nasicola TaxID=208480 RepID=A0A1Q5Q211_9ACTO|nr:glycoside hydrolase family 38 C-terminal domain-containing protein [Bowdeniella nasicola]OKL53630.1 hypothetical protein BSZ39_08570 [Bowdeniella nasicola]
MHDHRPILDRRVERTLRERILPADHRVIASLAVSAYQVPDGDDDADLAASTPPAADLTAPTGSATTSEEGIAGRGEPISREAGLAAPYEPFAVGDAWGPTWGTTWFHLTCDIPEAERGEQLELVVDLGWADHSPGFQAEALVMTADGTVIKAINPRNQWIPVPAGAERVDIYLEASANPLLLGLPPFIPTADGEKATSQTDPIFRLVRADLVAVNADARALAYDLQVAHGIARTLPADDARGWQLLLACQDALDALDLALIAETAGAARAALAPALSLPARPEAARITAVGHAHIDSAWLWPIRETRRKVVRTLANVLRLIDDGSEMVFALPAAQHLAWLKADAPDVFDRVRDAIAAGSIVPVGGMWIEPDAVLPGSEAMARQFVEGQRFFRDEFDYTCPEMWLPDSFGYSGALPQLARLAGARWFLTQKISWNQINTFPHHTLSWEGIDGTRIFTHFPPVDTYGAEITGEQVAHAAKNFRDKGRSDVQLMPYGYGDGGGGPTRDMLERIDRFADVSGASQLVHESPAAFFARAEADYAEPPVWVGELYLELHRGTFTSQANTKLGNRRAEHLLREAELWCAHAALAGEDFDYPYDELDEIWREVLLYQFHDILPGTSIAWVHREVTERHAVLAERISALRDAAIAALVGDGDTPLVLNAGPLARTGADGTSVPALAAAPAAPAAPAPAPAAAEATEATPQTDAAAVLDNGIVRATFDATGAITSLTHLASGREVVPPGEQFATLMLHEDFPNMWDAWDVDPFYRASGRRLQGASIASVTDIEVRVELSFGDSHATLTFRLDPHADDLRLTLDIDWAESEKFLKLCLPVDIHAHDAAFETQFGHIRRAIHENTSWDAARFEVSTHRWVHVGEPDFGIAVANSASYGLDITRHARTGGGTYTLIRPSILRAPRFPDPQTDRGHHTRTFAIRPGATLADAIATGYDLNLPLTHVTGARVPDALLDVDGALVESVKLAYDRSGDLIVRLYEPLGARTTARVALPWPATVTATNLLEDASAADASAAAADDPVLPPVALEASGAGTVATLQLRPFQVATLRIRKDQK